jgi:ligand-binding sensor domain-containing protein
MINNKQMGQAKIFIFLIIGLLFSAHTNGQEQWKTYYSYQNCFDIAETPDFVIGATRLGLIYYHKETSSLRVKNKNTGLSDSGISAIQSVPQSNTLLVGYENGNIDIIQNDKVFNIPDLKIESLSSSKQINHFLSVNGRIFCSTDFGILELDIEKNEIATTFIIGEDASFLKVNKSVVRNDSIFAATEAGILAANTNSAELAFYQNWTRISQSATPYCDILATPNEVFGARVEKGGTCNLVSFTDSGQTTNGNFARFYSLSATDTQILVSSRDRLNILDLSLTQVQNIDSLEVAEGKYHHPSFRKAIEGNNNQLWVADWNGGLFFQKNDGTYEQLLPPGPASNKVFKVVKTKDALWTVPGGFSALYDNAWRAPEVSILSDNQWTIFNRSNTPAFASSNSRDLINITVNPENPGNVFVASWGNGFYEFEKNIHGNYYLKNHFVENNSGIHNYPNSPMNRYTRIWAMTFGDSGQMYITNSDVEEALVVYSKRDSIWYDYNYGTLAAPYNKTADLLIDNYGQKWLFLVSGTSKGLFVFDDNNTIENVNDDRYRGVLSQANDPDPRNAGMMELWDENGELLTNNIYCLAKDHNGYIWIGTDLGVLIQYDPGNVFNKEKPVFSRIKVPRNDGTGLADFLLENQRVTAITIDGANRKYIGTEGTGLYIISEDGTKTVNHYTTSNSPIPSDNISDIFIDEESGEVFVATAEGLISLMGDAIQGADNFSEVYVYPNPVRPSHEGPITITGLMDQTTIKITDTAGNLVYETISLGGKAMWNGKNLWGERVKTGIYIVFLSLPDGGTSEFTKIAFIR